MWKPSSVVVVCPPQRIECDKMEEVSSIELTVATFTDYRLECIESGIYQLVHASAEKFFAKPFLSLTIIIKKTIKSHTVSTEYAGLKQTTAGKPSKAVV